MCTNGPGRSERTGMSLFDLHGTFPDEKSAEQWFVENRWPGGVECVRCGSDNVQVRPTRKPQPYRCRDCRKDFSVKTGTLMQASNLPLRTWAYALYLMSTSLKGQSSMKLHRDLGVTQKTAWHLAHRIREAFEDEAVLFSGPVEVDETYMGGKRRNMHYAQRKALTGRGAVGKTIVVGAKDRATNMVSAEVVPGTDADTLQGFVKEHADPSATVYTDDLQSYTGLPFKHRSVPHSRGTYVIGDCHTNGMESFWSMLKRAHQGIFHKMSPKHMHRYAKEFAGRHNIRPLDTIDQMTTLVSRMAGKRLRYKDLKAPNGLSSGALPARH